MDNEINIQIDKDPEIQFNEFGQIIPLSGVTNYDNLINKPDLSLKADVSTVTTSINSINAQISTNSTGIEQLQTTITNLNPTNVQAHMGSTSNPHGVTKSQIGLGNVPNTDCTSTANITDSTDKRFMTDAQKASFASMQSAIDNKVDKVTGKGLSAEDYTTTEKTKLSGIESNANNYSLPVASESVSGGIKVGNNLTMTDGVLSSISNVTGESNKKYRMISGVIRQDTANGGWYLVGGDHNSAGISSLSVNGSGNIVVSHNFTASKVVSLVVSPDETLQWLGVWGGASVGTSASTISLSKDLNILLNLGSVVTTNTTVDEDSSSGQTTLYVASTTGLAANDKIIIGNGTSKEELAEIQSINSGVSLVLKSNLTYTHIASEADAVRKYSTTGVAVNAYFTGTVYAFSNGDGSVTVIHPAVASTTNYIYTTPINGTSTSSFAPSLDYRVISISSTQFKIIPYLPMSGLIAYNGSSWTVTTHSKNVPTVEWVTDHLAVSHESLSSSALYTMLTGQAASYIPQLSNITTSSFNVFFYDYAGTKVTTPGTMMKFFYHNANLVPCDTKQGYVNVLRQGAALNANNVYSTSGNLWLHGVMEIS